jgi:hypothetical protein
MRPMPRSNASVVNETMNAVMKALSLLDADISRQLFQDRISFDSFKKILAKTARIHPKVFKLMFEHLGARGSLRWIAKIAENALYERKKESTSQIGDKQFSGDFELK